MTSCNNNNNNNNRKWINMDLNQWQHDRDRQHSQRDVGNKKRLKCTITTIKRSHFPDKRN